MVTLPEIAQRKKGRPKGAQPALTSAEKQRRYNQRERERKAAMQRITTAAEALHQILQTSDGKQIEFPVELVTGDTAETFENIAMFLAHQRAKQLQKQQRAMKGR